MNWMDLDYIGSDSSNESKIIALEIKSKLISYVTDRTKELKEQSSSGLTEFDYCEINGRLDELSKILEIANTIKIEIKK